MSEVSEWRFRHDRAATVEAYRRAAPGGSDTCGCRGCRNFAEARRQALVFPVGFLALLDQLGIDPAKDGEVSHYNQVAPGRHFYGGWFHFVGTLDVSGDSPAVKFGGSVSAHLRNPNAPRLDVFRGLADVVQLDFYNDRVPWVLEEEELE